MSADLLPQGAPAPRPLGEEVARVLVRDLDEADAETVVTVLVNAFGGDVAIMGGADWVSLYRMPGHSDHH